MLKRNLVMLGLCGLLGACGFHLRGTEVNEFALPSIELQARDSYGELTRELERALKGNGVRVSAAAPYTLEVQRVTKRERALSYTSAARTAEFQLTTEVQYQIQGRGSLPLLTDSAAVEKVYVRDSNNVVGSEREVRQLQDEMTRELVQLLVRRLSQVTPAELEQLEETAQARARAEAEARRVQQLDTQPDPSPLQTWPQ